MLSVVWSPYGGGAMWINVAFSALLYAIWWSWTYRHYLKYYGDLGSRFMSSMRISIYMWSNGKVYVFHLCKLGDYVDNDYAHICVFLYVDTWLFLLYYMSYDGYIDYDKIMYRMT